MRTYLLVTGLGLIVLAAGSISRHVKVATIPNDSGVHVIGVTQGSKSWYELLADDPPNHLRACNEDFCPGKTVIIFE